MIKFELSRENSSIRKLISITIAWQLQILQTSNEVTDEISKCHFFYIYTVEWKVATFGSFVWFKTNISRVKDPLKSRTGCLLQCKLQWKGVTSLWWGFMSHITVGLQETIICWLLCNTNIQFFFLIHSYLESLLSYSSLLQLHMRPEFLGICSFFFFLVVYSCV